MRRGQTVLKTIPVDGAIVRLVRCDGCGLVFLNPRLADSDSVYESDSLKNAAYYSEAMADDLDSFGKRLGEVMGFLPGTGSVIDIGASVGTFLAACRAAGFSELHGVELNPQSRAKAREVFGLELSAELRQDAKADLVNMSDLIEHLPNPLAYLSMLRGHISEGGAIMITTPDFQRWITHVVNIKPREHIFYFTKDTLKLLLEKAGFEIVYLGNITRFRRFRHLAQGSTGSNPAIQYGLLAIVALRLDGIGERLFFNNLNNDILCIARPKRF